MDPCFDRSAAAYNNFSAGLVQDGHRAVFPTAAAGAGRGERVRCCFLQHRKSVSEKRGALRLPCTKLGTVLCAAVFGNDSAVNGKSDTRALFSSPPRGALLFSAPEKKEEGAEPFSKRVRR